MTPPQEFYVEVWDHSFGTKLLKMQSITSLWYEDTIDKGAQGQMTAPYTIPELTRENLQAMNRVKIYKGSTQKWEGFINRWSFQNDVVSVEFLGLMSVLEKRLITDDYSGPASDIAAEIMTTINGVDDTGLVLDTFEYAGTGVTVTVDSSTNVFTKTSHGLSNGMSLTFKNTGGALPDPLEENVVYYVKDVATDTFKLEFTVGGVEVNILDNGTGTTGYIVADRSFSFSNQTVHSALKSIADSVGCELFIDLGGLIKIVVSRGSDKSNPTIGGISFKMLDSRPNENNIEKIDVVYDGSKLYNKVIGSGASLTSTKESSSSQTDFGLLEQAISFGDVDDQETLDEETQNYVDIYDGPIEIPRVKPISEKIDESLYDVGDTVAVRLERGFYSLSDPFRIVSKRVTMRQDRQTTDVEVGLSDRPQSRADILTEIAATARRVYNLEQG